MPLIRITEEDFSKNLVDLESATKASSSQVFSPGEDFTWEELIHAAYTSGHEQEFFLKENNFTSAFEAYCIWKRNAVCMSIEETDLGTTSHYVATEMLERMDPSERQGASYQLGVMMTAAWARRRLDVPWLLHLDLYGEQYHVQMNDETSRSRPDLIGLDRSGMWSVFECKGRKNQPGLRSKKDAKRQVMRVSTISNQNPANRVAVFAYFTKDTNNSNRPSRLECLAVDPEFDITDSEPLAFDFVELSSFFEHYYRMWKYIALPITPDWDKVTWWPGSIAGYEIGLHAEYAIAILSADWAKLLKLSKKIDAEAMRAKYGYWAGDGIVIRKTEK